MSGDTTYATAPFDHAKANIILLSSDNIDFFVFKLFLSLTPLFFETLFDIPNLPKRTRIRNLRSRRHSRSKGQ